MQNGKGFCQGGKPDTGKLCNDVCLCGSALSSECVVNGLSATAAYLTLGAHAQRGLRSLVCVCVCPFNISLFQHSFVPQTIFCTSWWMKIRNFVRFSLKILCCKDRAFCLPRRSPPLLSARVQLYACAYILRAILTCALLCAITGAFFRVYVYMRRTPSVPHFSGFHYLLLLNSALFHCV